MVQFRGGQIERGQAWEARARNDFRVLLGSRESVGKANSAESKSKKAVDMGLHIYCVGKIF